jgi:hypothetical protein
VRQAHDLPSVSKHRMLHFELHSTLAFALAVAGDAEAASREVADAPRFEGLSRWPELDRDLIEGYVALARGDARQACGFADQVLRRGVDCPLYRQSANQLIAAIQHSAPREYVPAFVMGRVFERVTSAVRVDTVAPGEYNEGTDRQECHEHADLRISHPAQGPH